jgi:hypothetical protein
LLLLYAPRFRLFVQSILLCLYGIRIVVVLLRCAPAFCVFVFLFGILALVGIEVVGFSVFVSVVGLVIFIVIVVVAENFFIGGLQKLVCCILSAAVPSCA